VASPVLLPQPWTAAVKPTTAIQDQSDKVQNIQARVVQHHYVRAELRDINMRKGGGLVQATLDALKLTPQGRQCTNAQLLEGFQHMTRRLQSAELTNNIKAASWFMNPNNFVSYSQMYERAVRTVNTPGGPSQQMRLKDDPLNPAQQRAAADSKVTFRKDMMAGGQFMPAFGGLGASCRRVTWLRRWWMHSRRIRSFQPLLQPQVETGLRGSELWTPAAWLYDHLRTQLPGAESQVQNQCDLLRR
jgi:hypothetical protein